MPGWLDSGPVLTDQQTQLVNVQHVGSYAICPTWADGHRTGYYSFALLRARCPCPICLAARPAEPTAGADPGRHGEHA
jgi:hypothetical protein